MTKPLVEAAGGVVWRLAPPEGRGPVEVLVVHRPKYDDWSLPKGKLDPGETHEQAALREVEEETGLRCRLGVELPETTYRDRHGRPKRVRYWAMEPEADATARFEEEIDDGRWLDPERAADLLSYARDREVVAAFAP